MVDSASDSETDERTDLALDAGSETFSVLAGLVCRFVDAWDAHRQPPDLASFLPREGDVRKLTLVELIKTDLEYRWGEFNEPKRIQEYQAEFPELAGAGLPADLIYEEFLARHNGGLEVSPEEYFDEFPDHRDDLRPLFGLPGSSTAIVSVDHVRPLENISAGQTVEDFELLLPLGRGAFARVFLARQVSMQRLVAVKISADTGTEPQTLSQLDHDHIVRVFDQRTLSGSGLRMLYMQYVPGGTLHSVVKLVRSTRPEDRAGGMLIQVVDANLEDKGELRPSESAVRRMLSESSWPEVVAWLGARLAAALAYAHRRRVLHRDIKPANVLLTAEGQPKLADFNISYSEKVSGATPAAYFGGSLAYMSPEQLEAFHPQLDRQPEDLGPESDLYSLGVMLWELLVGERPYPDETASSDWNATLNAMIARRRTGPTGDALGRLPAECPATFKRILGRCLAAEPGDRWRSADELHGQLEICLNPDARELIDPANSGAAGWQRRYAIGLLVLMVLVPNAIAGLYNYTFNAARIPDYAQIAFENVQRVINMLSYPAGIGIGVWLAYSATAAMRSITPGATDGSRSSTQRCACLRLGEYSALACLALWAVAGVAYPIALDIILPERLPIYTYLHFIGSLVISGLIATSYPFFLVSFFCVRRLFPVFAQQGVCDGQDGNELRRLQRRLPVYLVVAACIPLLAVAGLSTEALYGFEFDAPGMLLLCLGGIAGLAATYGFLYRPLQSDLSALISIIGRA